MVFLQFIHLNAALITVYYTYFWSSSSHFLEKISVPKYVAKFIEKHLKSDSHLPKKICVIYLIENPFYKNDKKRFLFHVKSSFVLKIFKFLSRLFGHVGKTASFEREGKFQNSWRHSLVYKQFQYTYCPISHKVKATRQWNLIS